MKIRGIILKSTPFGEADKFVTVLAKGIGKITLKAKNSRSTKSKIMAGTNIFSYCDFITYDSGAKNIPSIKQIDIIESFFSLSSDIEKLSYASYFTELTEKISFENHPCDDILYLLIITLKKLNNGSIAAKLTARIFELKLIQYSGFTPNTSYCCGCTKAVIKDFFFSPEGIVCGGCKKKYDIRTDYSTIYVIKYILSKSVNEVFDFGVSENVSNNLEKICRMLIRTHFEDLHINSYDFIQQAEKLL